mmetsp:Transcript_18344/g.42289  ORF Transcript_18344/g.42289 Transcript_18344/m.42289 type:complete len:399 (-) Transcript_18344:537-1733(-)
MDTSSKRKKTYASERNSIPTTASLYSFSTDVAGGEKQEVASLRICDDDNENGQLASKRTIREEIISKFPQDNLIHCFGYGSGVFSQSLSNDKAVVSSAGMLDLIMVVDNTWEFHRANLQRFPQHYAPWLRYGGPDFVTKLQRQGLPWLRDAQVLFHVVDEDEHNNLPKMKYGVIDREDLERDLTEWESLYLAGRLHKPTLPIVANDDKLLGAQIKNLRAAMAAALILSPPSTSKNSTIVPWSSLYRQIAALSYTGDFRMQVGGEDPKKLDKLVQAPGQLQRFHDLYRPILKFYETNGLLSVSHSPSSHEIGGLEWDPDDPSAISYLEQQLPRSLRKGDVTKTTSNSLVSDQDVLAKALAAIVAPAARNQSFKGIFTLGFRKSIQYACAKLSKGLLSRK